MKATKAVGFALGILFSVLVAAAGTVVGMAYYNRDKA